MLRAIKYRFFQEIHIPHCLYQNNLIFWFGKKKENKNSYKRALSDPKSEEFLAGKTIKATTKANFNKQES